MITAAHVPPGLSRTGTLMGSRPPACNTELIASGRICGAAPAQEFTAYCQCGDKITGYVCPACAVARLPGCFTCWQDGGGHQCPVEFASATCLCGCGGNVSIATRSDARYQRVCGRPCRFVQGHNFNWLAA